MGLSGGSDIQGRTSTLKDRGITLFSTCIETSLKGNGCLALKYGKRNCTAIKDVAVYNEKHGGKLLSMPARLLPWSSHQKYGYTLDQVAGANAALEDAGTYLKEHRQKVMVLYSEAISLWVLFCVSTDG